MGEVNAAERAALSGTLGSLQPEFEQNFNCEQSLNKVWIWNNEILGQTKFEHIMN